MNQKSHYKISDVLLCIKHDHSILYEQLHHEIKRHAIDSQKESNSEIHIRSCAEIPQPPEGAILIGKWFHEQREEYILENKRFLRIQNKVLIISDYVNQKMEIVHGAFDKDVLTFSRIAMKWLIIKVAERFGHTYVHGSALRYKNRNLLFAGDSGSGKSSFLFRLLRLGGQIITDDALLLKEQQIIPFSLNVSMRSDFAKRFGLSIANEKKLRFDLSELVCSDEKPHFVDVKQKVEGLDILVLPRVHYSKTSHIEACTAKQAMERLGQIYEKEVSWNAFVEPPDAVKAKYKKMLEKSICIFFYAGHEEEEIKNVFFNWLEKTI